MFYKKNSKKKVKCYFYFEASEYSLMLKLTNFVIWNNFSSFHYAGTKKMKQLKSLITMQKLAEKLWNFEMGPLDDFVCQYI